MAPLFDRPKLSYEVERGPRGSTQKRKMFARFRHALAINPAGPRKGTFNPILHVVPDFLAMTMFQPCPRGWRPTALAARVIDVTYHHLIICEFRKGLRPSFPGRGGYACQNEKVGDYLTFHFRNFSYFCLQNTICNYEQLIRVLFFTDTFAPARFPFNFARASFSATLALTSFFTRAEGRGLPMKARRSRPCLTSPAGE